MYLTAAQRLINFVCSVCHVRWARGCPRQHICSKYLKNRWRYYGKLKKKKNECKTPRESQTHTCAFFIIYYILYTSKQYKLSNAGCFVTTYITKSAHIPWRSLCTIRRRNARRHALWQRVPRPRASNATCAAEMYNDHTTDLPSHETQGFPSLPVDSPTRVYSSKFNAAVIRCKAKRIAIFIPEQKAAIIEKFLLSATDLIQDYIDEAISLEARLQR